MVYLISPDRRRLSLEETEIKRLLGIPAEALRELVDHRLLRRDLRADSAYYELGHDSLIEPVLSRGRTKARIRGKVTMAAGCFFLFLALTLAVATVSASVGILVGPRSGGIDLIIVPIYVLFFLPAVVACFAAGMALIRRSRDTMRRYRNEALSPRYIQT